MMNRVLTASLIAFALATGCVPKKDVPASEVPKLTSLKELMDAQATTADPVMGKTGEATYSDADYAAFAETASRIAATSTKAKEWSKGPEFDAYADKLHANAEALGTAANAFDAKGASDALAAMKSICKCLHS